MFKEFVAQGEIPNMLLAGTSGVGKTTVARALCEELGCDYMVINGSEESGIDVLRTKIKNFASTVSFSGKTKVVILDEADYLNCFAGNQKIRIWDEASNSIKLESILDLVGKEVQVLSYNFATKCIEIVHAFIPESKSNEEVFEVTFEDGTIMYCTKDHPFFDCDGKENKISDGELFAAV